MRIGVFDSGIGGINVLSCLIEKYPHNEYVYFGDTKNLPYGDKQKKELLKLASSAIEFLISKNVEMIIIACGTISSTCYNKLKKKYDIPIYDIISPTISYLKKSIYQNIGVIGTKRTIESNVFNINKKNVIMHETPSFVPIIENNLIEDRKKDIIDELKMFENVDILVLGCTHYPLLKKTIEEYLNISTLDMGEILSKKIKISNGKDYSCKLYFSSISVNLIMNIENVLQTDYQIYLE